MRFDLVSIFPEYFAALDLSLLGRAQGDGHLEVCAHNLRDWADGKHRSVDSPPAGGGPGMVMRADVWGRALDQVLAENLPGDPTTPRRVLAVPTPAGEPLTQRIVESLTTADQIVIACGRYEGIDSRVPAHYRREGVEVLEFSVGDYVLNGGEVAALILVEAVGRLLDGVMGNPDSLVEESHGAEGLLEYPAFTTPQQWRDQEIPAVLRSGDHALIARWRRDQSLARTARTRPDLLQTLSVENLDRADRETLAHSGWLVSPELRRVRYRPARVSDVPQLARLAAETFPDACPPHLPKTEIERFIAENLSEASFIHHLQDKDSLVFVAQVSDREGNFDDEAPVLSAYTLTHRDGLAGGANVPAGAAYLSKCYTDADYRGSGVTGALLNATVAALPPQWHAAAVVLGTNVGNKRARKFYQHHGFRKAGRRKFYVGDAENLDDILVLHLTEVKAAESGN